MYGLTAPTYKLLRPQDWENTIHFSLDLTCSNNCVRYEYRIHVCSMSPFWYSKKTNIQAYIYEKCLLASWMWNACISALSDSLFWRISFFLFVCNFKMRKCADNWEFSIHALSSFPCSIANAIGPKMTLHALWPKYRPVHYRLLLCRAKTPI